MDTLARRSALVLLAGMVAACTTAVASSTAPTATPTPALAAASALPFADEMAGSAPGSAGKAGTYQTRQFTPAFAVTVPAGWGIDQIVHTFVGAGESPTGIPLSNGSGTIVVTAPSSLEPPAPGDAGAAVPA